MTDQKSGKNLTGLQQFIISTLTNTFADTSNRSIGEKVARAAITSIPEVVEIDTKSMYNSVANRYPNLGLQDHKRPADMLEMSQRATQNVIDNDTELRVVAYYVKK